MNAPTTDLITQKNSEYDNLPGLILGLDGWILRSLPKQLRAQFITGYEKLLRTVFHPDRFQDAAVKASRQLYLQNVGEAVRFMLADEFSYDITADTVPSRKNPMLSLREAISVRDGIISTIDEKLEDQTAAARALRLEVQELRHQILKITSDSERRSEIEFRLKIIVRKAVRQFPAPIGLKYSKVTGRFIGFEADTQFVGELANYSSRSMLFTEHPWIDSGEWIKDAGRQQLLGQSNTLNFRRAMSSDKKLNYSIVGAMTIAHLCEFIRGFHSYPDELAPDQVVTAMNWLCAPVNENEEKSSFRTKTYPYLLPFYNPGMLLLMLCRDKAQHDRESEPSYHRLFVVDSVDVGEGPKAAEVHGLRLENKEFIERMAIQSKRVSKLKHELELAKAEAKVKGETKLPLHR